ncbi:MAG: YceI family protein [Myxococcales bacterium]|nr:YceI family protein [Myxococcales bacterium]
MRLESTAASRVLIDLRATGFLQAIAHSPTLVAHPEPFAVELEWPAEGRREEGMGDEGTGGGGSGGGGGAIDVAVDVQFLVSKIQAPASLSAADRAKMVENLRGADVLDAARFPRVEFHGRYAGTGRAGRAGRLHGEWTIRGRAHPVDIEVHVTTEGGEFRARGAWEGTLSAVGIKPFRALLGALRLDDWIRLRLEASLAHH